MTLGYVSADVGGYDSSPLYSSYSSYTPLDYVGSRSGGKREIVTYKPSVFSAQPTKPKEDDEYHFGDGTKAVLKGTGRLVGGALDCVGNVLEFTGDFLGGVGVGYGFGAGMGLGMGLGFTGFPYAPMWHGLFHHHHHHCFGGPSFVATPMSFGGIGTFGSFGHFRPISAPIASCIGPGGIRIYT